MLKEIKNHFMFNEVMLPDFREMQEAAEQYIIARNPEAAEEENLSDRAAVIAGMAWEELCAESEQIDELFGAPLPITERFEAQLEDEDESVREQAEELFDMHNRIESQSEVSLPVRFFLQRHLAGAIATIPEEATRFSAVLEFVYPDDLGIENSYTVTDEGLIVEALDKDGLPIDRDFLGQLYGEYVYPLQALGFRHLKALAIKSEADEDLDAFAYLENLEDLFGEEL